MKKEKQFVSSVIKVFIAKQDTSFKKLILLYFDMPVTNAKTKLIFRSVIQGILGHSDQEMTLEYIDVNFDRIKQAFDKSFSGIVLPDFCKHLIDKNNKQ